MIISQCGNCGATFTQPKIITRSIYGVEIKEKVCPECSAIGYTKMSNKLLRFLSKYDNINNGRKDYSR